MSIITSHLTHHHISSVESVISHRNHCRHVPTSHSGCHIEVIVQVVGANCLIRRRRSPRNMPDNPISNPASPWPVPGQFQTDRPRTKVYCSRITYMYNRFSWKTCETWTGVWYAPELSCFQAPMSGNIPDPDEFTICRYLWTNEDRVRYSSLRILREAGSTHCLRSAQRPMPLKSWGFP